MDKAEFERIKKSIIDKRNNEQEIKPKYPYELFGIECGKGWKHLYEPIISFIIKYNQDNDEKIEIHQVKEKFGELRIYLSKYTLELRQMIDEATEISRNTCEICGKHIDKPIVKNHWIYSECEDCYNNQSNQQEIK